ncbi:MAG: hypothetical protein AB7I79_22810, partial [Rhizobiaceae bacterium]
MKFGAVRDVNSLSALMIARDDHDSALSAAPKPRHHLQGFFKKIIEYQNDNEHSGMILNKDGSFQRTARFRGPDLDSAVPAELIAVAGRLNNAFRRLGS